ncbi:fructokinase [Lactobacillus selangorensis]|uniref:Fructokinase n=1 Tax=Lactobacillus selangorensis TaxID=81857 RepID=A0A0R2FIZ7_9LACO|nr:ROK family protein [Lactobacillus selangorensis]KRN28633.1 fructokinase [Lactobacillus selangorensis]KRN32957.1 fructokinase [Lactobacillus selangorensis]
MTALYGGIEAGGTKFVCAVGDAQGNLQTRVHFPTTTPEETLQHVFEFFDQYQLTALAIGSFGPIDINPDSDTYGYITDTPKEGWRMFDFYGSMKRRYPDLKIVWTTDVNVAAYGEYRHAQLTNQSVQDNILYTTIGTGVGSGFIYHGSLYQAYSHPETGHILVRHAPDDTFSGDCPYHGDCLEGMAAGPALEKRAGKKAQELAPDDPLWKLEAYYIAQACVDYTLQFAPAQLIFGGGVMNQEQLFPLVREEFTKLLNGYVATPNPDEYIIHARLGDNAGIVGSILLAAEAK